MVTDGNEIYHGCHFITYRNIESLCCTHGNNSVLGQLYFSLKNDTGWKCIKMPMEVISGGWGL